VSEHYLNVEKAKVHALVNETKQVLDNIDTQFKSSLDLINRKLACGKKVLVWGVNNVTQRFIDSGTISGECLFVDDDPRKKEFINNVKTYLPSEKQSDITKSSFFVVCSSNYQEHILNRISTLTGEPKERLDYIIVDWVQP
jgi:hypothetical protein